MDANDRYEQLKRKYMRIWHTWNVRSVLSHVRMPEGMALNLCIKEYQTGAYLKEALIGRQGEDDEQVYPEAHDGCYTRLRIAWRGLRLLVETAADGDDFAMLVTPEATQLYPPMLVLESGFLWNRSGWVRRDGARLIAQTDDVLIEVGMTAEPLDDDANIPTQAPYLASAMRGSVGFWAGTPRDLSAVKAFVDSARRDYEERLSRSGGAAELLEILLCALHWDTFYDAKNDRVISPVSRLWSINWGGYVLFCWDTYFAARMAAEFDPALALMNLVEIMNERTAQGFVPNFASATGQKSWDRSQPPVGSRMLLDIVKRTGESWVAEWLYPALLEWNEWFFTHRSHKSGALGWGSDPCEAVYGNQWEVNGVNERFGAALESGLDNSPMYDDVPFDSDAHLLCLEDVGLTGLYIMDCDALIELARGLRRDADMAVLEMRKAAAQRGLEGLWDEQNGFYYNRHTDTGEFSRRISPTNFYALFSGTVSEARAKRIANHYFDPAEFYGEWMIPSIARNDPAYADQDYWRGRIWAPMNYLVYLAIGQRPELRAMREDLAERSKRLILREWRTNRHIHENYNGDTGEGCDKSNSDRFYHWGALLALIALIDAE